MHIYQLLYFEPLLYSLIPNLDSTLIAEILNLCLLRITHIAEVVKENVNQKVMGQVFASIFADVLWRQLHLASLDVVAVLNERCVEHYPKHCLGREPCVPENYLYVTSQDTSILLLLSQKKYDAPLFCCVLLGGRIGERFLDV